MNQLQTEDTEISKDENIEPELPQLSIHESIDNLSKRVIDSFFSDDRFQEISKNLELLKKKASPQSSKPRSNNSYKRELRLMSDLLRYNRQELELNDNVKFAKKYLEVIRFIYEELIAELGRGFYKIDTMQEENKNDMDLIEDILCQSLAKLLYRIEKFVLIIRYSHLPAYIPDVNTENRDLTDQHRINVEKKRITVLGYELLYLLKNMKFIGSIEGGQYLSSNIKLFFEFFEYYFKKSSLNPRKPINLLDRHISFSAFNELNFILLGLKKMVIKGEFEEPVRRRRGEIYRRKNFSEINIKDFKDVNEKFNSQLLEAIKYFRKYKNKNIVLYRFRIFIDGINDENVSLGCFKKFFTELNKKANKPEAGFKGYLNFFYYWDVDNGKWFQDIIILIDADTLLSELPEDGNFQVRNIQKEFEDYVLEVLNHRGVTIFENEELPSLIIKSVPVLYSLDLPSSFIIECGDKENWKIFEEKILPYYCYHEILEITDSDVTGRFSRGRK